MEPPVPTRCGPFQSLPGAVPGLASVVPLMWREKGEARGWLAAYAAGKLMLP